MHKYMRAGVREYWVADLERRTITTFIKGEPMRVYMYQWSDEIPVGIYDGALKICMEEMDG